MKPVIRIAIFFSGLLLALSSWSQDFSDIQEYNQRLLMNPAYTGTSFGSRLYSHMIGTSSSITSSYTTTISADFYIDDEKIGLGAYGGVRNNGNTNTFSMWGKGSYSKFLKLSGNRYFIPAISMGFDQPLKKIPLFAYDMIVKRASDPFQPPGGTLPQPLKTSIKTGFLYADYNWNIGLSFGANWLIGESLFPTKDAIFRGIVHWEKFITYYYRGLLSKRYYLNPRLIVDYSSIRTLVYSDISFQRFQWLGNLGVLYNLNNNHARIALSAGYDFTHFKLSYQASTQVPTDGNFEVMHSLFLRLVIPELNKKHEPIYPLVREL